MIRIASPEPEEPEKPSNLHLDKNVPAFANAFQNFIATGNGTFYVRTLLSLGAHPSEAQKLLDNAEKQRQEFIKYKKR